MKRTILVTGASGKLGGAVANALWARGFRVRAAVRSRKGKIFPSGVRTVPFDYDDPGTYGPALAEADGIFLVAPPLDPEAPRRIAPFLEEARKGGRSHVVLASALCANVNEGTPLRILERAVTDSGLPWTVLRPTFFMENFSEGWIAPSIREKRAIFLPAGEGRTGFVSVDDVAAVASAAFEGKRFGGEHDLTGPDALDHYRVARILGEELGEEVRYIPLDEEPFLAEARERGMPEGSVLYLAALYRMVREGHASVVTGEVERVAGRKPAAFREFARRNLAAWRHATS